MEFSIGSKVYVPGDCNRWEVIQRYQMKGHTYCHVRRNRMVRTIRESELLRQPPRGVHATRYTRSKYSPEVIQMARNIGLSPLQVKRQLELMEREKAEACQ